MIHDLIPAGEATELPNPYGWLLYCELQQQAIERQQAQSDPSTWRLV